MNPYIHISIPLVFCAKLRNDLALLHRSEIAQSKWGIENGLSKSVGSQILQNQVNTQSSTTHLDTVVSFHSCGSVHLGLAFPVHAQTFIERLQQDQSYTSLKKKISK